MPCSGRSRNFEQKGLGYDRGALETQRTTQSNREVPHPRKVENYPYISSVGGSLQADRSSADMLGQITQLCSGEECPQHCFPGNTFTWRFLAQELICLWKLISAQSLGQHSCGQIALSCKQGLIKTSDEVSSVTTSVIVRICEINKG